MLIDAPDMPAGKADRGSKNQCEQALVHAVAEFAGQAEDIVKAGYCEDNIMARIPAKRYHFMEASRHPPIS